MSNITTDREEQIDQLIAEYVLAEQNGKAPSRESWLAAHPSLAAELAEFLDDRALFASAVRPIRAAISTGGTISGDDLPTIGLGASSADTDVPLEPATMIGEYRLIAEIARGGMGVVYKAHHERLNRTVALKMVLPGRLASGADLDRFHAEARAAAKLSDPHIVPIYEIGEYRGRPFFSMQFVPGGSLREHATRYRNDPRATAKLIATAARAVHHAHLRGILHRDLKPGNILIDEQGEPHVTDFGLAKRLESDEGLTEAGGIVGTPSYMSPEQAGGKSDLTTAVDVWALGAVLYELLTGQPPFRGATPVETMMQAVVQDPPAPRSLDAKIDADLETICMKCLEKEPARRYGTAAELADDLDRTLAGEPILAKPATLVEQATKWSRRHPLLAGSFGMAGILACCFLIAAGLSWRNAEARAQAVADLGEAEKKLTKVNGEVEDAEKLVKEYREAATKQKAAADEAAKKLDAVLMSLEKVQGQKEAALAQLKSAEDLSQRTMYAADMQLAHAAWQTESLSITNELLERQRPQAGQPDLRGFEWRYLWRLGHSERLNLRMFAEKRVLPTISGLDVSPDGGTLAAAAPDGKIKIWDLQTGKMMRELDLFPVMKAGPEELDPAMFGVKAAKGELTRIIGIAWKDGQTLRVTLKKPGQDFLMKRIVPAFMSKEKATLAMVLDQLEARDLAIDGQTPPQNMPVDPAMFHSPLSAVLAGSLFLANDGQMMTISSIARSANGKVLSMCGIAVDPAPGAPQAANPIKEGKVVVWDLETKSIVATYTFPSMGYTSAISADGKLLAVGSSGSVLLYDVGKAQPPRELPGGAGMVQALAFTSDGSLVAAADMSGAVRMWNLATGKEQTALRGHISGVNQLAFAVGETALVSAATDGELRVWDLVRPAEGITISGHEGVIHTLAFSAGGGELTAADARGKFATYSAATGAKQAGGEGPQPGLFVAALSAKGTWYAAASVNKITVRDTRSGQDHTLTGDKLSAIKLAFSPDEQYLAASAITGETLVWKTATWEQLPPLTGKGPYAWGLVFAPNGPVLATAQGGKVILHDLEKKTSRTLKLQLTGLPSLSYSPDGSLLAAGGAGEVRVYDLAADRERLRIAATGKETGALVFSADNRRLAAVSHASTYQCVVRMYDLESGREVLSLPLPRGNCTAIAFSPDSRRLAAAVTHNADPAALVGRAPSPATIKIWEAP